MERRTFAILTLAAGLLLGALGDLFFYGKLIGLSFPVFISLSVALVLGLAYYTRQPFLLRNLWPVVPLLFFAYMVAVRADWQVTTLNVIAVLGLGALVLQYLPLDRALDEDTIADHGLAVLQTGMLLVPAALSETGDSWNWLRENRLHRGRNITSALRGMMFAVPVLMVFGFLLGSADAVFASYTNQVWSGVMHLFGIEYLSDTIGQGIFTMGLAGTAVGAIGYGVWRRPGYLPRVEPSPVAEEGDAVETVHMPTKRKPGFKLSMIESGIILGSVAAMFGVFVAIQFAYFFGGRANIGVSGLTYAEYARRGFFELVAVSILTLGLSLWLERVTVRQEGRETRFFKVIALLIVGLTTVMLVSACQRMWLYEEAFGFTQLRVYVHVFIVWLGVMFGVFTLALFRLRKNIFSLGLLVVIIGYLVTLNLMNVDAYIADRNIARYHDGAMLDAAFLSILSADAVPSVLSLYQEIHPDERVGLWSGQWLAYQLQLLDRQRATSDTTIFSANLSRQQAWSQLDAVRDTLPAYDPQILQQGRFSVIHDEFSDLSSGWDYVVTPTPGSVYSR